MLCASIFVCFIFGCTSDHETLIENDAKYQTTKNSKKEKVGIEVEFFNERGTTVTNENGIYYSFSGITIHENKVYPEAYWGTYPLYFFGQEAGIRIKCDTLIGNNKKYIVRIAAYILKTDGSNGAVLLAPVDQKVVLKKNQTLEIDGSFTAIFDPSNHESGLDRLEVSVFQTNSQGKIGKLIAKKEAVFCPPELQ